MRDIFNVLKPYLKIIITILIVALVSLLIYAEITPQIEMTFDYIGRVCIVVIMDCLLMALWLPYGKQKGRENEKYVANATTVSERIKKVVDNAEYGPLEEFCKYATDENVKTAIINACRHKNIDYERYQKDEAYKASLGEKRLEKIIKIEERALRKTRLIKGTDVTTCSAYSRLMFDIRNNEKGVEIKDIIIRLLLTTAMAIVGVSITIRQATSFMDGLGDLIYWLSTTATTLYFSIDTGYKLITVVRNDYCLRLNDFLLRYEAWKKGVAK